MRGLPQLGGAWQQKVPYGASEGLVAEQLVLTACTAEHRGSYGALVGDGAAHAGWPAGQPAAVRRGRPALLCF